MGNGPVTTLEEVSFQAEVTEVGREKEYGFLWGQQEIPCGWATALNARLGETEVGVARSGSL